MSNEFLGSFALFILRHPAVCSNKKFKMELDHMERTVQEFNNKDSISTTPQG